MYLFLHYTYLYLVHTCKLYIISTCTLYILVSCTCFLSCTYLYLVLTCTYYLLVPITYLYLLLPTFTYFYLLEPYFRFREYFNQLMLHLLSCSTSPLFSPAIPSSPAASTSHAAPYAPVVPLSPDAPFSPAAPCSPANFYFPVPPSYATAHSSLLHLASLRSHSTPALHTAGMLPGQLVLRRHTSCVSRDRLDIMFSVVR